MPPKTNPRNTVPVPDSTLPLTTLGIPAGTMATTMQTSTFPPISPFAPPIGIRLPPIVPYQPTMRSPISRSPGVGPHFGATGRQSPGTSSFYGPPGGYYQPQSAPQSTRAYGLPLPLGPSPLPVPVRLTDPALPQSPGKLSALSSPIGSDGQRGVKRPYEDMAAGGTEGYGFPQRATFEPNESRPDRGPSRVPPPTPYDESRSRPYPMAELGSVSSVSTPSGTTSSFPTIGQAPFSRHLSESSAISNTHRLSLHMRQQPRAARAGPDGRDRRSLDPPPVIQLLMTDFDPDVPSDVAELRNSFFVVHCHLVSANSPRKEMSTLAKVSEDGSKEIQRLLLGTSVASPFQCMDDPDPENAPSHPVSVAREERTNIGLGVGLEEDPPSPSNRFILPSVAAKSEKARDKETEKNRARLSNANKSKPPTSTMPSTFFIFADLSVRKAGEYRLEFSLMKIDHHSFTPGSVLPIIATVTSAVFKVVNAKDFDQVQPSTRLVRGLLERGAGFPLKLKKGTREGVRRRVSRPSADGAGDEGEAEGSGSLGGDGDEDDEEEG